MSRKATRRLLWLAALLLIPLPYLVAADGAVPAVRFVLLGGVAAAYAGLVNGSGVAWPLTALLLGHALVGLQVERRQLAYVAIRRETLVDLDAEDVDSSEITTALLAMDGITVVLLFRELEGGRVKVSLRSKGILDVHRLAAEFGGGGHRNASGIVMEGTLEQAVQTVTQRTTALLAN